ncbi:MAG: biotin transporter BioY [Candidatus Puniceispirillaceae bacterium]
MTNQSQNNALPLLHSFASSRASDSGLTTANKVALVIGGSILLALSAHIKVPFYPVPVTMQTMLVLLIGMTFGSRLGFATILAYLAQGAMGLPVFAGGAGLAYMAGPTGGYLFGFAVSAFVVGMMAEKGWGKSYVTTAMAMILGNVIIYAFGVTWLSSIVGSFDKAIQFGLAPFIYGDLLKIVIATILLPVAWKMLPKS